MSFRGITFVKNNQSYFVPDVIIPNSVKFELIKHIIIKYNYIEFNQKFDKIYNTSFELKPICYYIKLICDEYISMKRNGYNLAEIIKSIENKAVRVLGRRNSKLFHVDFIPMILFWRHYKIYQQNMIQDNNSSNFNEILKYLDLKEELKYGYGVLIRTFNHYLSY